MSRKGHTAGEQVSHVAFQRAAEPVHDLKLRVLRTAFQSSECRLANPQPARELPLAYPCLLTQLPKGFR